jgi:hypothetical protein
LGVGALKDAVEYIGAEGGKAEGSDGVHESAVWRVFVLICGMRKGQGCVGWDIGCLMWRKRSRLGLYLLRQNLRQFIPNTLNSLQKRNISIQTTLLVYHPHRLSSSLKPDLIIVMMGS